MNESSDRLSGLPEHILVEILSLLPLKSAISTAVLSRRWQNLWTQLPSIDLSLDTDFCNHKNEFYSLVKNLLPKLTLPSIQRFSLDLGFYDAHDHMLFHYDYNRNRHHILSCFDWAIHHKKGLKELRFNLSGHGYGRSYPDAFPDLPLDVFQISSLVVLKLTPWLCVHQDIHEYNNALFILPKLRKIDVELHSLNPSRVLEKLVSSCPSLEELSFQVCFSTKRHGRIYNDEGKYTSLNLSSHGLKFLDVKLNHPTAVSLNTPNLEYIGIHVGYLHQTLPHRIFFVNVYPRLLASSITARSAKLDDMLLPSNLFSVLPHVLTLTLLDKKVSPLISPITFTRLTRLTLELNDSTQQAALFPSLSLLHQCPHLEVLTVDMTRCVYSIPGKWSPPLNSAPHCVKRVEIIACSVVSRLQTSLLQLLTYLFTTAQVLEFVTIRITPPPPDYITYGEPSRYNEQLLMDHLFQLPRTPAHCILEFYGLEHIAFASPNSLSISIRSS